MQREQNQFVLIFCVVGFVAVGVPILLNYLLQIPLADRIIGDEETWLNFWAVFIGSLINTLMVVATFLTLKNSSNFNRSQRQLEWLYRFRAECANLISTIDTNRVKLQLQNMAYGYAKDAVNNLLTIENSLKKSNFVITALLKEYDNLFNLEQGDTYIKMISTKLTPFIDTLSEIIQYAAIYDLIVADAILPDIDDIVDSQYSIIKSCLSRISSLRGNNINSGISISSINETTLAQFMQALNDFNENNLVDYLLSICKSKSSMIHSVIFFSHQSKICPKE